MNPIQKRFMVVCVLLILALAVWYVVLLQEAKTKAWNEKWMLDSDGNPIRVRVEGRVWEMGKGYRNATEEETRDAEEHERGRK